jgi:dienelactone hydrolase
MKIFLLTLWVVATALRGAAAIRTEVVEYREGDTTLEGFLAYDDATSGPRPGVVIVHQWKGLSDYEKKRAEMLAGLGYVAFCADIYGQGVRPATAEAAGKLAGKFKGDRPLLRQRVNAALAKLKSLPQCNPQKTAALGYCFGGTTALELARSGAETLGVVSFHGGLGTPTPQDAKNSKARVLALHGADDPFVPAEEVAAFQKEMREAGVDWQLVAYGGAVHSFTDWNATGPSKGAQYHERTDKRSWEAMRLFLAELFR